MLSEFRLFGTSHEVSIMYLTILVVLTLFTVFFYLLSKLKKNTSFKGINTQMKSWWIMVAVVSVFIFANTGLSIFGVGLLSFVAFRELLSSMKFRRSDRSTVGYAFLAIPIQYLAIYLGYNYFALIFIPAIMFLILPFRNLLSGNIKGITKSNAILQWSLMITVYSLGHIAMLIKFPEVEGFTAGNLGLVLYMVFISQFNDILQFCFGKALGKRKILPKVSPNKTWEGFLGGFFGTVLLSYLLSFLTFFTWWQAIITGVVLALAGFAGDVNISSIKRDLEIKDLGNLIEGHGGIMDRIDSLTYTSIVFFHLTYLWSTM